MQFIFALYADVHSPNLFLTNFWKNFIYLTLFGFYSYGIFIQFYENVVYQKLKKNYLTQNEMCAIP